MEPKEANSEAPQLPPIVEEYYDVCRWVIAKVSKFQKDQKYILGIRLQNTTMDTREHIIDGVN